MSTIIKTRGVNLQIVAFEDLLENCIPIEDEVSGYLNQYYRQVIQTCPQSIDTFKNETITKIENTVHSHHITERAFLQFWGYCTEQKIEQEGCCVKDCNVKERSKLLGGHFYRGGIGKNKKRIDNNWYVLPICYDHDTSIEKSKTLQTKSSETKAVKIRPNFSEILAKYYQARIASVSDKSGKTPLPLLGDFWIKKSDPTKPKKTWEGEDQPDMEGDTWISSEDVDKQAAELYDKLVKEGKIPAKVENMGEETNNPDWGKQPDKPIPVKDVVQPSDKKPDVVQPSDKKPDDKKPDDKKPDDKKPDVVTDDKKSDDKKTDDKKPAVTEPAMGG